MKRLVVVLVLAAALAGPAAASARSSHIRVIEHALTDATTDTGAPGDSAGDILTFANPVFDRRDARQVGTDQGYCIRVVAGRSYECTWTTLLKGGQIMVQGPFYDAGDSTLAITGGTGRYRRARGTMHLHALAGGTKYRFDFRVR
jgi:allene oxide cyclase